MIKGLVTVGTTTFNSLVTALDKESDEVELVFQIANGSYTPLNHPYTRFIPNIQDTYKEYDFVITHAGAGSVYNLMENHFCFAVVPNLERADDHQLELAKFVNENKYAYSFLVSDIVEMSLNDISIKIANKETVNYEKTAFFKGQEIIDFLIEP